MGQVRKMLVAYANFIQTYESLKYKQQQQQH